MQEKTFRIGEAAEMLELKSYVLRYWETEFPQLVPNRTEKGQRLYTSGHVDLLRNIKDLLHVQGMTLEGARRVLAAGNNILADKEPVPNAQIIAEQDNGIEEDNIFSAQDAANSSAMKSAGNKIHKDELNSIFMELTSIKELLGQS